MGTMRASTMKQLSTALCLIFGLTSFACHSIAEETEDRFYQRKAEGWFWYAPEPEPEPEKEPEKPIEIAAPPPTPTEPEPVEAPPSGPAAFSAAWFRENLPKYKDLAWDNPTVENVRMFLYLQRFAIDRSEQFSDTTELAVVGDPFLDEISRRPAATFASQQVDRDAGAAKNQLLKTVAERVGIFYFFKSDDEYSDLQAPLVKMLEHSGGFSVVPISVDGKPLPSNLFPLFKKDDGHAEQLGVTTYPAIFLVSPEGQFAPIGQGPMSLPELNHRILVAAKRNGWVSDTEYNKTRPVLNMENNISEKIASPNMNDDLKTLSESGDDSNFIPPDQLMNYIQERLQGN